MDSNTYEVLMSRLMFPNMQGLYHASKVDWYCKWLRGPVCNTIDEQCDHPLEKQLGLAVHSTTTITN